VRTLQDNTFLLLIIIVSVAFAWILWPFYGAVLWAIVFATVFAPAHRRLLSSMHEHRNLAALITLLIIVTMVLLPLTLVAISLVQEATTLSERIQSGELDFGRLFQQVLDALPPWATSLLARFGVTDLGDLQQRLSVALKEGSQVVAAQALAIGQGTAHFFISLFVMLYLLFFLLRDGLELSKRLKDALPLRSEQKRALFSRFAIVIRAMFKGSLLVAALQGALGGLIFWIFGIPAGAW
jgi:predicted PurR-regulated permease PerM